MKTSITVICLFFLALTVTAQSKDVKSEKEIPIDSSSVLSIDKTIKTLYNVISGETGKKRQWNQFKFLFTTDAKLIAAGRDSKNKNKIQYMSPDDYIKNSGKWLETNGFFEKEIHRTVNTFGNIAQIFSTYECFYNITDKKPFMRGINSIQLWHDGKRWWIVNIYWTQETKGNPIPEEFLPEKTKA